ncbi:MAG: PH domain-containing protein [Flaviflexus sp.]|nr:PH domain-containing protein [Flaviflexus sp.]
MEADADREALENERDEADSGLEESPSGAVPDSQWVRPHWLTPLLRAGELWGILVAAFVPVVFDIVRNSDFSLLSSVIQSFWLGLLAVIAVAAATITLLAVLISYILWRFEGYALTEGGVHTRRGMFRKKSTFVRWQRIHSVEITWPFLPRLFGLGQLEVLTGSSSHQMTLGMLGREELERLRGEVRQRAGLPPEEREEPILSVPLSRLIGSILLRWETLTLLILGVVTWIKGLNILTALLIPVVVPLASSLAKKVNESWSHRVWVSDEGLRITYGLTTSRTQIIAPERVHAISLSQPFFWRLLGWWRLEVGRAGVELMESSLLTPVATRREALLILDRAFPAPGTNAGHGAAHNSAHSPVQNAAHSPVYGAAKSDVPRMGEASGTGESGGIKPEGAPAPGGAHVPAPVRAASFPEQGGPAGMSAPLFEEALFGIGSGPRLLGAPAKVRRLKPLMRRRTGIYVGEHLTIARSGVVGRQTVLARRLRGQGLVLRRGPVQRALGLATLCIPLIPGPTFEVRDIEWTQAARLGIDVMRR